MELFLIWCFGYFGVGILFYIYWLFFDKSEEAMNEKVYVDSFWEILSSVVVFIFLWPVLLCSNIKKWFTKPRKFPWNKEN